MMEELLQASRFDRADSACVNVGRDRTEMEALTDRSARLHGVANEIADRMSQFLSRMGKGGPPSGRGGDTGKPIAVGHIPDLSSRLDDIGEALERVTELAVRLGSIG